MACLQNLGSHHSLMVRCREPGFSKAKHGFSREAITPSPAESCIAQAALAPHARLHSMVQNSTSQREPSTSLSGVQGIAVELLKLARQGLSRRGLGEERFLQPLDEIASSGKTLADQLLEQYQQQWHGDIDRAYSPELTY